MKMLQGAVHVFTDRPDLTVKAFRRELKYQENHKTVYERIPQSTIIQYPMAVSYFCHLGLSYDYIAKMYSNKRKSPVVVSIVGRSSGMNNEESQVLRLYCGVENRCIAQIETISEGQTILVKKSEGLEDLKNRLGWLIPTDSLLFTSLSDTAPLKIASALSSELGIFLGDVDLDSYLKKCRLRESLELGTIYDAESR